MVDGLNKIATIKPKDTRLEAENYKKLIVSYSKDPRVTVLKLADRLEVMRSLDLFPKLSRERKILETLLLYIPLAHQLGLYNSKSGPGFQIGLVNCSETGPLRWMLFFNW